MTASASTSRATAGYDRIVPKFQKLVKARGGQGYYMRGTFTHHNVDFTKDLFHMADDLALPSCPWSRLSPRRIPPRP